MGITKEVEALTPGILHRGSNSLSVSPSFVITAFVHAKALFRAAAAEDDEGIRDDVRTKCLAASRETPMLQKSVHVNDGEQRTGDAANAHQSVDERVGLGRFPRAGDDGAWRIAASSIRIARRNSSASSIPQVW